ncbi:MAG: M48 family metallopeptidase [Ruminococcus sp.]|nr:M48 family metallopeptidase [Ruminococcus sp.]
MPELMKTESMSPLGGIDCSFENYVKMKRSEQSRHLVGTNIMDYAYSADLEVRKKLDSIPGLYTIAKRICSTEATKAMHSARQKWLEVGPNQFPEIYELGCECAQTLGIGVPNLFVTNDDTFNAFAYGSDEIEPFIVIGNLLLRRYPLNELKGVIGHECGHIQNAHIPYYTLANMAVLTGAGLASLLVKEFGSLISTAAMLTVKMWSRAAEVTADRAGLICTDTPDTCFMQTAKLMYAAVDVSDKVSLPVDIEAIKQQMKDSRENPSKISELFVSHPYTAKRVAAEIEFANCETFFSWRPELQKPGQLVRSKALVDERCMQLIDVLGKGVK